MTETGFLGPAPRTVGRSANTPRATEMAATETLLGQIATTARQLVSTEASQLDSSLRAAVQLSGVPRPAAGGQPRRGLTTERQLVLVSVDTYVPGLRTVRTGHAYRPPACYARQRLSVACSRDVKHGTSLGRFVRTAYGGTPGARRDQQPADAEDARVDPQHVHGRGRLAGRRPPPLRHRAARPQPGKLTVTRTLAFALTSTLSLSLSLPSTRTTRSASVPSGGSMATWSSSPRATLRRRRPVRKTRPSQRGLAADWPGGLAEARGSLRHDLALTRGLRSASWPRSEPP